MVGLVLMGWEKGSNALHIHYIFLVNLIKHVMGFNISSIPSTESVMRLPIFSPIVLVILASILIILLYLLKTSELMNRRKLIIILASVLFLFLLINFFLIRQNRDPAVKFRLSLVPVQNDSALSSFSWMGDALWNMTTRQLQHAVLDQAIVAPQEWSQTFIMADSIFDLSYLRKINSQLNAEYILFGKIRGEEATPTIRYQIIDTRNGEVITDQSLSLSPQNLPEISTKICDAIFKHFKIESKNAENVIRYVTPDAYQKYLTGTGFYRQRNYQFAIDLARQAIEADSGIVEAFVLTGKSYFMKGIEKQKNGDSPVEEFERARQWLTQAISIDSTLAEAYNFLGEYYIYRERWSLAEQTLAKALRLNPNYPRLYLSLSRLHQSRYQKLGFKTEVQLFQRALFINPNDENANLMLADFYLFKNQRKLAIQVLEKFLQINHNSIPALMALGKIYLVRNEMLKIVEIYNRVLELEPNNSDAYYNLGILYYNSNDFENAEKLLKRAIAINNHLNAHLYLAYLFEKKSDDGQAIEQLRQRIRYRKGLDDEFAEEARKHLVKLLQKDSTQWNNGVLE